MNLSKKEAMLHMKKIISSGSEDLDINVKAIEISAPAGYIPPTRKENRRTKRADKLKTNEKGQIGRTHRVETADFRDCRSPAVKAKQKIRGHRHR
jgi:hypothetical protein